MRFRRRPKIEAFQWTDRKLAAFDRKDDRARARLATAYPLLHEHLSLECSAKRTADEERALRDAALQATERTMRDLVATHWRKARHAYFQCAPAMRAAIQHEWRRWPGPAEALYLLYVVEKHNGTAEKRRIEANARDRRLAQEVADELASQARLPF